MKTPKKALDSLIEGFDQLLTIHNFKKIAKLHWSRDVGWKTDEIQITGFRGPPSWDIVIHFRITMPRQGEIPPDGMPFLIFDDATLTTLLGSTPLDQRIKLPRFSLLIPSFVKKRLGDVEKSLPWFDARDTLEKCLALLLTNNQHGMSMKKNLDSPSYKNITAYLRFLIENKKV